MAMFPMTAGGGILGLVPPAPQQPRSFFDQNQNAIMGLASALLEGSGWSPVPQSLGSGLGRGLRAYQQGALMDQQLNKQKAEEDQWASLAKQMGLDGIPSAAVPGLVTKMLEGQYGRKEPKVVGNYLVDNEGKVLFHDQGGGKQYRTLSPDEAKQRGLPTDRAWQIGPNDKIEPVYTPRGNGLSVTLPDGTEVELGGGGGAHGDLAKPTVNRLQDDLVNYQAGMDRLRQMRASARPEFLTAQGRMSRLFAKGKDYVGASTPEEQKYLSDFTAFRSNTLDSLNRYIKEITGAAMTNTEAERIMSAMPTPDDSPSEFSSKWDATMTQLSRANARAAYTLRKGLPLDNVALDDMDKIINERAREIMNELKARNPGISEQEAIRAAQQAVNREFGQ